MDPNIKQTFSDCLVIDPLNLVNEYKKIVSAAILGSFAYFNNHHECICINAFSLMETERTLKFGGPFEVNDSICDNLCVLYRRQALNLDIFYEIGSLSYAWVRPAE